jgi:hypothetical protein
VISQDHYNKCKNLHELIEENTLKYKQVVEPHEREVKTDSFTYLAYEGIDPDAYRKQVIEQLISSVTFDDFYKELISGEPRIDFYLYGKRFRIDVKEELEQILNLSLMMYKAVNAFDTIQEPFEDLYFRIYDDKFTIEVNTTVNIIIKNFDSGETQLLNQEEVKIKIRKNPNSSYAYIVYEITDSKKNIETFKINPLQYPQTIFDISVGILRIYTSPRIEYVVNNVTYSPGCPRFLEPENPFHSFKNYYPIKISELQTLLQKAYSSEEKIKLTIERSSIACGRESDYDRLLDLVIA